MKRRILQALLVLLGLGSLGMAGMLFLRGWQAQQTAHFVEGHDGNFSATAPFAAEGVLATDSTETLKSPLNSKACLAYRIKYDFLYTTTDGDGETIDKRVELLDDRKQVDDLKIVFENGQAPLDLQAIKTFYGGKMVELEALPEYVSADKLPEPPPQNYWFEAYQNLYTAGQKVTVVGQVGELGNLVALPGAKELILFPGDKAATVTALKSSSKHDYMFGFMLIALGLMVCLVFGLILKYGDLGD